MVGIGALPGVVGFAYAPSTVDIVGRSVLAVAALTGGVILLFKVLNGRRCTLHLYEEGIVVAWGKRCEVYPYRDVTSSKVDWTTPDDSSQPRSYAIKLNMRDGRHIAVTVEAAVPTIMARVVPR